MTAEPLTPIPSLVPVASTSCPEGAPADHACWAGIYQRFAARCVLIALAISLLALVGWVSGLQILAGRFGDTVPMAPATVLTFLLLGSAFYLQLRAPASVLVRAFVRAAAGLVILWSVVRLGEWAAGYPLGLEQRFIGNRGKAGDVPVGYMTPLSGFSFLFAGLALLLRVGGGSRRVWGLGATLPLPVIVISLWVLWAYVALPGAQFFRPGQTLKSASVLFQVAQIPMAIPTAITFLALGLGLVVAEGPQHFLFRHLVGSSTQAWLLRGFLPRAVALVIVSSVLGGVLTFILPFDVSVTLMTLWTLVAPLLVGLLLARIAFHLGDTLDRVEAERQRILEELRHARDVALASIRAKDTFLANMSHELRTPLNHIIGFCQLLEMAGPDEDMLPDINKIRTAGNNLLVLINDILDFGKIEAGKLVIEAADFNAAELADEVAAFAQTLAGKKANTLVLECPKDLGIMHSDRNRVRQVLNNLLSNACKFTDHGTITVRARRELKEGDWLVFETADTGIGMTPEQMGRLFQPFEQADSSISRRFGGTGLGLMLSRSLCRAMGGDVSVTSVMGKGSVFTARLPARLPKDNGSPPRNGPAGTPQRTLEPAVGASANMVLVIDDDPAVLELMGRFLGKAGFVVRTASSGEEGLRLAKLLRPATITLDTVMPGIDGWAVLAALKTDAVTAHIPVIMATMIDDRSRGFALGATDFVTKPIDWDRLSAILKQHCPAASGTVLVVDDEPEAREVLRRMLEGAGWQVVEAEHGRHALEQLKRCQPTVILLDLMMPEMDGFAFVQELRKNEACSGIPIVVLTAKEITAQERQWLNGCVVKILQKGAINQDDLFQEIQRQVTHRCRAAPAWKGGA
jgi:signal transduction histidine kinase/CheY-like chemotaxis protein